MAKVTISDVARQAGVSKQTVSRALNNRGEISEETRQRVLDVADGLGYRPSSIARSLATQRTYSIGVTVPEIIHPFYAELVTAMQHTAADAGYWLFQIATGSMPSREEAALQWMLDHWVDGVIPCRMRLGDDKALRLLQQFKAAVMINPSLHSPDIGQLWHDNRYGMALAVNHLASVGCRNVSLLGGRVDTRYGEGRVLDFFAALKDAGLEPQTEFLRSHTLNVMYDWSEEWMQTGLDVDSATIEILRAHPEIDGLLGYNDMYAVGALRALRQLGRRVPQDVAVMGIDDMPIARLVTPSLTTLDAHCADMGAAAVKMVIDKLEGRAEVGTIVLKHSLVVRESTTRSAAWPGGSADAMAHSAESPAEQHG